MESAHAKVLTLQDVLHLSLPLPKSWQEVAGILKGKPYTDPLQYQHALRQEWEQRLNTLINIH